MTPGDKFELHGQKWECVQDLGNGYALAVDADHNSIRQVFLIDICIDKEAAENVRPEIVKEIGR